MKTVNEVKFSAEDIKALICAQYPRYSTYRITMSSKGVRLSSNEVATNG
jgi:hypothetical protein